MTNVSADDIIISSTDITVKDISKGDIFMENIALTEAVFYILLSLKEPLHGYGIMQNAEKLSGGRVKLAAGILKSSYASQLLITNDICLKCMLRSRGGEGYTHILRNIVPMLAQEGFELEEIKQRLLHDNPLRMLCGRL